ncbi:MAG TPA: DUF2490 domain-containing protein [Candidatus Omnitrophota bacterium]|nr:DUF2490 domain-containing protein [Candidatus Omnitrophota bacterium]HPS37642.1 DUF2490 domain-containing protein [Candidatus Omnitrophota bacterium]
MKRFSVVCYLGVVLFLINLLGMPSAAAMATKDEGFGIWNTFDVEKKLNAHWKIRAGEELRYREHNGLYYAETHVGANYQPFKYVSMGAEYLENRASRSKGKDEIWYWESVPRIYLTPQLPFKGFLLENRSMLEFRIREDARFAMRYRNLTGLTAPWKWTPLEFQPYTANEVFFETQRNGLIEDRYFSGFKMHWWGPIYGSVYYLRHSAKNAIGKWTNLNILGIGLKYSF